MDSSATPYINCVTLALYFITLGFDAVNCDRVNIIHDCHEWINIKIAKKYPKQTNVLFLWAKEEEGGNSNCTFDVEIKKASKNGLLRNACLTSEKTNAHFMRVHEIISHQRYCQI